MSTPKLAPPGNHLGLYLRQLREAKQESEGHRRWSQAELALRLHIFPGYVSMLERGIVNRPSEPLLAAIALHLDGDLERMRVYCGRISASDLMARLLPRFWIASMEPGSFMVTLPDGATFIGATFEMALWEAAKSLTQTPQETP